MDGLCAVSYAGAELRERAADLAAALRLPLVSGVTSDYRFLLFLTTERLELRFVSAASRSAPSAVFVDFVAGRSAYRRRRGGGRREPVARACGLATSPFPHIIDATAGLGRDAFVLASLGCQITLIERNPIVAALLADGLRRAKRAHETAQIIGNIEPVTGDSVDYLQALAPADYPDVIYLDPMYPASRQKNKSRAKAAVKKEQQVLQALAGRSDDCLPLLNIALQRARKRVVLKRPRRAPVLMPDGEKKLQYTPLCSGNTRFDIYFPQNDISLD